MQQQILVHSLIPIAQLVRGEAYLNGRWIDGNDRYTVRNPHTDGGLASVRRLPEQELADQLATLPTTWRELSATQRQAYLDRWLARVRGCQNALALILSEESGICWQQARSEIRDTLAEANALVQDGLTGEQPAPDSTLRQISGCAQRPFRSALIESIRALLAGEAVLLRPSRNTPLSTLALAVIAERVTVPAGAFNVAV